MKNTKLIFSFVVLAAVTALFMGILGCEKDGDTGSDLDDYFAANPYISDPRDEGRNSSDGIDISPSSATVSAIGQTIVFTISGGDEPISWAVSGNAGTITQQGNGRQAIYKVTTVAENNVIASDVKGRAAIADIEVTTSDLAIVPSQTTISGAGTARFTATGGNPPYEWSIGLPNMEASHVISGANNQYYDYTVNVLWVGTNSIIAIDSKGDTAQAAMVQLP